MSRLVRTALLTALLFSVAAHAQFPDKFTNLRVLPKDIAKSELQATMRGFSFAVGVRCEHCHVEKQAPDRGYDFAADDKQTKKTARLMLRMVAAINADYVGKVNRTDGAPPVRVQCATCHHGLAQPQPLYDVLAASFDKDGLDRTVALYHELRGRYYGTGQYDFGQIPLNLLAESLLAKGSKKEALAISELNISVNHPGENWSYQVLAMIHEANGETEQALAAYRKALGFDPANDWARQKIEALSKQTGR